MDARSIFEISYFASCNWIDAYRTCTIERRISRSFERFIQTLKKEKVVEIFEYCLPYFSTWTSLTMTWLTLLSESGARVLSALRTRPSSMHNYEIIIIKSVLLLVAVHTIVVTHLSRHTECRRPCHPTPLLEDPRRLW